MEEIFFRFSHLGKQIFELLDKESLAKCKKVDRLWHGYLEQQKFLHVRAIVETVEKFHNLGNSWERILEKSSTQIVIDLREAAKIFYRIDPNLSFNNGMTPLHLAATSRNFDLFKSIESMAENKEPKDTIGWSILHAASQYGSMEILVYVMGKTEEKYPLMIDGWTLLHSAVFGGHLMVCEYLIEKMKDKNPAASFDDYSYEYSAWTPLHLAAKFGHLEICKLILNNVDKKEPTLIIGKTPLMIAAEHKQFKVCAFIASYMENLV